MSAMMRNVSCQVMAGALFIQFSTAILMASNQPEPVNRADSQANLLAEESEESPTIDNKSSETTLQVQPLDEPIHPLKPLTPMSDEDKARAEAMSWYLAGRVSENRGEYSAAYEAYSKAVALDPNAVEVYHALVPLAFRLDKVTEALAFVDKAIELSPDDFKFLKELGEQLAATGNFDQATKVLQKAAESKEIEKKSASYVEIMRMLGILYSALGKPELAANAYEVVFNAMVNPADYQIDFRLRTNLLRDSRTSFERIGQVFLDAKRPELAIQAFEHAAQTKTGTPGALSFNLAQVYLQTKQHEKALDELQKYFDAQLQSKGAAAYQLLADILAANGTQDTLIPRLQDLATADPHNSILQYFLASQYVAADRLGEAERLYEETLTKSGNPDAFLGLAAVYRLQSRPKELLKALGKTVDSQKGLDQLEMARNLGRLGAEMEAIQADKELVDKLIATALEQMESEEPDLSYSESSLMAKLAGDAEQVDQAVKFYRHSLSIGQDRANAIYQQLVRFLMSVERYDEAAEACEEAIDRLKGPPEKTEEKASLLLLLSQVRMLNGDIQMAVDRVHQAMALLPDNPNLHYQEATIYSYSRQWDRAIDVLKDIIQKNAANEDIVRQCRFVLSNAYVQNGNYEKGEEILEKLYRENQEASDINNDLGYLYADKDKNLEQAEKMIRKALDTDPENGAYLDSMGWVLYRLGRFDEALSYLLKASNDPSGVDATIWDHLGDCYDRMNQHDKALEAWNKAIESFEKKSFPDTDLKQRIQDKLQHKEQPAVSTLP